MTLVKQISDGTAKACVEAAIAGIRDIDPVHLAVTVDSSVVIIYGEVDNELQRTAVLEAAGRASGQRAVVDRLLVREPWQESDDVRLAAAAGAALERLRIRPATSLTADVRGGTITLRGTVTWPHQRQQARDAVAELPGVTAVRNAIVVADAPLPSATDVRKTIATALEADLDADLAHLEVLVDRHRVTLHGHVASHDVKREAERAAAAVPGVQYVDSRLVVHTRAGSSGAELWSC